MTIFFIIITVATSVYAFNNSVVFDKLKFNAYLIHQQKQWYRFLSYGLIHADWMHLLINMYVLWSFGDIVETIYRNYFMSKGVLYYVLLYIGGIGFSSLYDYRKHKENGWYNAVGASGAVSSIVFASIILYPEGRIFLFFIPIGIPSIVFGILYLVYSAYMARNAKDNIGHSAHFWGAIFGAVFTIILKPRLFLDLIEILL